MSVTHLFQSSAGFDPGRYGRHRPLQQRAACFNPRPGLTPAATVVAPDPASHVVFQSSAGFDPGRYEPETILEDGVAIVSILGRV